MPSALEYIRFGSTGELADEVSSSGPIQLPNLGGIRTISFKAPTSNLGNVYLGTAGVTRPDGVTDETTGFELAPGDETGWIPAVNLNEFYAIADNAADKLFFVTEGRALEINSFLLKEGGGFLLMESGDFLLLE